MITKAELHVHLEGTVTPDKVKDLARKNNISVPDGILSQDGVSYVWNEQGNAAERLMSFVTTYDRATSVIQSAEDYFDITYDYLKRVAGEGSIYQELTIYADPEPVVGISFGEMISGISDAIDRARTDFDIETRLIASFVRHFGIERSLQDARTLVKNPHKYVTAIGLAGAETAHQVIDFKPAYDLVTEKLGLQKTAHAGEATGPKTIRDCYDHLGITRFGHMVRIVEDPDLMKEMADIRAVAEVCPTSNIALKVYDDYTLHPLRQMYEADITITINSDDPPFFKTSLGREYDIARDHFGFSNDDLSEFTRNAINAAFVDTETRKTLLKKLDIR